MSRRTKRLEHQINSFMRIYQRKHVQGELNDRQYSRKLEAQIKRMDPRELSQLLHGDINDDEASTRQSREEPDHQ